LEKNATSEIMGRLTPAFKDPTEEGWKKLCCTDWIQEILARTPQDDLQEEQGSGGDIDLSYKLYDIN
jgi:hypothetical protein